VCNWAIAEGFLKESPFKRGSVNVVKLSPGVEAPRTRRLDDSHIERRLIQHADPHLRAVLVAALSTGCRIGELLSLQWGQVRRDDAGEARWLVLPADKTKTGEARVLPIGADLRAVLSLRRHAPGGEEHGPSAYVFGDDAGGRVRNVRRQWEDAVLRAHGHEPTRSRGKLTAEALAAFKAIDLHVHDLRREFASRLLESSADLHDVQMFLGHAAITTTSRYLQSTPVRLARALDNLERAGFAHRSHAGASSEADDTPVSGAAPSSNSLN
jgi:integrase